MLRTDCKQAKQIRRQACHLHFGHRRICLTRLHERLRQLPAGHHSLAKKQGSRQKLFALPKAYSCRGQTVPSLERAFTEVNQYNDKKFYESCSFVDVARKAGFKISWFSNQSHIGAADTPVTLVANTADRAEWTKLHLNQTQYDESLVPYLKEIDPKKNNFIVFHLKGSHFNYINRYPQSFARFSQPDKYDLIPNYLDSIAYTDYVLQQIWEYAAEHLNLQAMVYFSDHAVMRISAVHGIQRLRRCAYSAVHLSGR